MTSRLALDVRRMTLTFDPDDPADRERMARVYRHARVLEHETRDGRVRSSPTCRGVWPIASSRPYQVSRAER